LAEVAGEAARLVEPSDTEALAAAILDVFCCQAVQNELRARGLGWVEHYRWARIALRVAEVYAEASGR
jgi:glycosyltransferase involved in cell wall biosynthesis